MAAFLALGSCLLVILSLQQLSSFTTASPLLLPTPKHEEHDWTHFVGELLANGGNGGATAVMFTDKQGNPMKLETLSMGQEGEEGTSGTMEDVQENASTSTSSNATQQPIPIVMWHGMGDWHDNPLSMGVVAKLLRETLGADLYIHSLKLGKNLMEEVRNGFVGGVEDLLDEACELVRNDEKLSRGFNAIGFSQGALFMRALVQTCNTPPVFNLVSVGGPQQGIYGLPHCPGVKKFLCDAVRPLISRLAYLPPAQRYSVQAQYWHDPYVGSGYGEKSEFLAEVNCERSGVSCDEQYKERMTKLENFVLVKFSRDDTVLPKETEWFGTPGNTAMEKTRLYKEDLIGLKTLKESGRLHTLESDGVHLQMTSEFFVEDIVRKYLAGMQEKTATGDADGGNEEKKDDGEEKKKGDSEEYPN